MTKLRLIVLIPLTTALLFSAGMLQAGNEAMSARQLIENAKASVDKAAQQGFEWTTTRPLIKAAEAALAKGNKEQGIKLAKAALNEAEKSLTQAAYAKTHWQDSIPR